MSLPVVDCRNLIQFCRAFHLHNNTNTNTNTNSPINPNSPNSPSSPSSRPRPNRFVNPLSNDFCHRSPFFALDLLILLSVIASLAFLFLPHFKFFFLDLLPMIHRFLLRLILDAPLPYFIGFLLALLGLLLTMLIDVRLRKCGNPRCKGLRRAVEYDIQLETEQCVKHSPPSLDAFHGNHGVMPLELGQDRKELEAELKKMAPLNGRTVLIFRARCGCPAGRLEVWGPKRVRRIKK